MEVPFLLARPGRSGWDMPRVLMGKRGDVVMQVSTSPLIALSSGILFDFSTRALALKLLGWQYWLRLVPFKRGVRS